MEQLILAFPEVEYIPEIEAFKREMLEAGSSMDGAGKLRRTEHIEEWLAVARANLDPATARPGWPVTTQFVCVRLPDRKIVGMIDVRHELNEWLAKYGGHIGYSVRPSERGKGYASWMLAAVLPFCRSIGLDCVNVNCVQGNEQSRRVIFKNGGVYENSIYEEEHDRWIERYRIVLEKNEQ